MFIMSEVPDLHRSEKRGFYLGVVRRERASHLLARDNFLDTTDSSAPGKLDIITSGRDVAVSNGMRLTGGRALQCRVLVHPEPTRVVCWW